MAPRLQIFVSVGPDLQEEREFLGQALARFPASLGWALSYTPSSDQHHPPDPGPIASSDFYLLILGGDIWAPMGWELSTAQRFGKRPLAFAKKTDRTPAALVFYRQADVSWERFETAASLSHHVQTKLATRLVAEPERYGLAVEEWQTLSAFLQERVALSPEQVTGQGAGESGVILSPGSDAGAGGVFIQGET